MAELVDALDLKSNEVFPSCEFDSHRRHIYLIKSEKGNIYIGSTNDLTRRLKEHNRKNSKYTKKDKKWKLIYFEEYKNIKEARLIERKIKKSRYERDRFYKKAGIKKSYDFS